MNKTLSFLLVLALLSLVFPLVSGAEFYKYTDESGVLRFTDDLSEVPEDQREAVDKYREPDDNLTPEQKAEKRARQQAQKEIDKKKGKVTDAGVVSEFEKLKRENAKLEKEYKALIKEKDDLVKNQAGKAMTPANLKDYNAKVADLNKRILDFQKRNEALQKKAKKLSSTVGQPVP